MSRSSQGAAAGSSIVSGKQLQVSGGKGEPRSLEEFLEPLDLLDQLSLFEERGITWASLKQTEEQDLVDLGLPRIVTRAVGEGLRDVPSAAIGRAAAQKQSAPLTGVVDDVDYEKMEVLPPLPAEEPPVSSQSEYKNYMRLRYAHQQRGAELPARAATPPPPASEKKSPRKELYVFVVSVL